MDVCRRSHRLNCQTSTSGRSSRVIPYPVVQVRHNLTTLGNRLLIAPLCLSTPIPPFQLMYLQRLPTPITLYAHSQLATKVLPKSPPWYWERPPGMRSAAGRGGSHQSKTEEVCELCRLTLSLSDQP